MNFSGVEGKLESISPIRRGSNSRASRVRAESGQEYFLKTYWSSKRDRRDRLGTEWRAFDFLWSEGVRVIPRPIAIDRVERAALFEAIPGEPLSRLLKGPDGKAAIGAILGFLGELARLGTREGAKRMGVASEACFSLKELLASIQGRLDRLVAVSPGFPELDEFLKGEVLPYFKSVTPDPDLKLASFERVLSPSDFGFHNMIRTSLAGREYVFVDFEYFGWDDPAKTISDFLLHPAMGLEAEQKEYFYSGMVELFDGAGGELAKRVQIQYPLYGVKWIAILLNEFLRDEMSRRQFADPETGGDRKKHQLQKARRFLRELKEGIRGNGPNWVASDPIG